MTSSTAAVCSVIDAGILADYDRETYPDGLPFLAADFGTQPAVLGLGHLAEMHLEDVRTLRWQVLQADVMAYEMHVLVPSEFHFLLAVDVRRWREAIDAVDRLGIFALCHRGPDRSGEMLARCPGSTGSLTGFITRALALGTA